MLTTQHIVLDRENGIYKEFNCSFDLTKVMSLLHPI
jgi:hypothetical protein